MPQTAPPHEPWEHRTSNIERPTSNEGTNGKPWMFDVGCSTLFSGSGVQGAERPASAPPAVPQTPLRRPNQPGVWRFPRAFFRANKNVQYFFRKGLTRPAQFCKVPPELIIVLHKFNPVLQSGSGKK
jgi:hypothetical protein